MSGFVFSVAAICFMVDFAGHGHAFALVLVTIAVVAQDTFLCRSILFQGWFSLLHLETDVTCDV